MPQLTRRRVLAAKHETTPGTPISLAGADAAWNCYDVKIDAEIDHNEREGQGGFSPLPGVPGYRGGRVTFSTDFIGGATDPRWASVLLPACGWVKVSGVYVPLSRAPGVDGVKTVTIGIYEDGLLKSLAGAMGTWKLALNSGKPTRIDFDFMGIWVEPVDAAILAPTYPTVTPLRFAAATLALGAWSPKLEQVTIDGGNQVVLRPDATTECGYSTAIITGRRVTGTMNPETSLVATKDTYSDWLNSVEAALSIVMGDTGNQVTMGAPKLQITKITESDRDKVDVDQIEFQCNRSAAAGDDDFEFTIA